MSSRPTKEQVAELSDERQDVIAEIALREAAARQKNLANAQGYRGFLMVPALLWAVGFCFWMFVEELVMLVPIMFIGTVLYIEFHARGINSRIDAVIALGELDRTPVDRSQEGGAEKSDAVSGVEDEGS